MKWVIKSKLQDMPPFGGKIIFFWSSLCVVNKSCQPLSQSRRYLPKSGLSIIKLDTNATLKEYWVYLFYLHSSMFTLNAKWMKKSKMLKQQKRARRWFREKPILKSCDRYSISPIMHCVSANRAGYGVHAWCFCDEFYWWCIIMHAPHTIPQCTQMFLCSKMWLELMLVLINKILYSL